MNAFRLAGDMTHLLSVVVLLLKIHTIKSCAGAYRVLYILNWIYRYFTEPHFVHWISWIAGIVQTLLYADFFYYYIMSWKNNVKLELPA